MFFFHLIRYEFLITFHSLLEHSLNSFFKFIIFSFLIYVACNDGWIKFRKNSLFGCDGGEGNVRFVMGDLSRRVVDGLEQKVLGKVMGRVALLFFHDLKFLRSFDRSWAEPRHYYWLRCVLAKEISYIWFNHYNLGLLLFSICLSVLLRKKQVMDPLKLVDTSSEVFKFINTSCQFNRVSSCFFWSTSITQPSSIYLSLNTPSWTSPHSHRIFPWWKSNKIS
jgi:hypothetical protein